MKDTPLMFLDAIVGKVQMYLKKFEKWNKKYNGLIYCLDDSRRSAEDTQNWGQCLSDR